MLWFLSMAPLSYIDIRVNRSIQYMWQEEQVFDMYASAEYLQAEEHTPLNYTHNHSFLFQICPLLSKTEKNREIRMHYFHFNGEGCFICLC